MRPPAYTPESLFRLSSLADPGAPAAHLRTWLSPAVGFPLHPLVSWSVPDPQVEDVDDVVWWRPTPDGPEPLSLPIDLDAVDGPVFAELGHTPHAEGASWWCWVSVEVADRGVPLTVAVADRGAGDRTLVQRSAWPYTLGASRITRLRFTGHGQVLGVRGVDAARFGDRPGRPGPVSALPLPDCPWYLGGIRVDEANDLAARFGPSWSGPLDRPGDEQLGYDDEYTRVRALTSIDRTGSQALLEAAYLGFGDLPVRHRTELDLPAAHVSGQAGFGSVEALLSGAADPGVARWLGLLATDPLDEEPDPERPYAWVSAGWWALDPDRPVTKAPRTALRDVLAGQQPTLASQWGRVVDRTFPGLADLRGRLPYEVRPFVTPVGLGAVPDLPPTPRPVLDGPAAWEDRDRYGRRIRLRGPIPGPVALTRDGTSRNPRIGTGGPALEGVRGLVQLPGRAEGPDGVEGALADTEIPGDRTVTWSVATADEFGRWSEDGVVDGDPPDRPGLPAPVVEAAFVPATGLPAVGTVVPGTVEVQVPVPTALGPGTLPVEAVLVALDGGQPDRVAPAGQVRRQYPAPATGVGGTADVQVRVWFADARGAGPATTTRVAVRDPRRPEALVTGPAVLWAGRPDPTGTAELALQLPAPAPGGSHHVYLAEETALRRALHLPPARGNRATRAKEIADAGPVTDRGLFTLAGRVTGTRFVTTLPGAVRTLRFIRVVPVTPAGREAEFAACPLVPVAVPGPDRPPSPALTVAADGPDLRLDLTAHGIDDAVLARLNPGAGPRYRLRRTVEGTGDPLYLRVVATGALRRADDDGPWTASVTDPGLVPFVRHTWQAEVCHPDEIALAAAPARTTVLPARGKAGDAAPAAWSAPSAPVSGMVTVPVPPLDARVALPGPTVTLRGAPVADPAAVGNWRLRVWRRAEDGALTPVDPPDGDGWVVTADLAVTDPGWAGESYALQLVDPLDRAGPLTEVPSPLLPTTTTLTVEEAVTGAGVDGAWLTGTVSAVSANGAAGPAPAGTVRFRTGNGIVLGEAPPGRPLHADFADFAAGDGTAVADYPGDGRHAPSSSAPRPLPEGPGEEGPPDGEA